MTNEQLAIFIQQDNKELIPILWDRVKFVCFMICGRYFKKYAERFTACGVELCDLRQESYAAFLQAVNSFQEGKGLMFVTFLEYPIRNRAAELLGIHNAERVNHKPLDNAVSLDKPIEAADNDNMTLADVIPDTESSEPFEKVLQQVSDEHTRKIILAALEKLTEQERSVIIGVYFQELTLKALGERMGVSGERVWQIKRKAISKLRCTYSLKVLAEEYRIEKQLHFGSRSCGYKYMEAQRRINHILRTGQYITESKRREIMLDCEAESDPVYKALEALGDFSGSFTRNDDTEIRQRAEKRLAEISAYREITYGLQQAIYYEERQKAMQGKQSTTL